MDPPVPMVNDLVVKTDIKIPVHTTDNEFQMAKNSRKTRRDLLKGAGGLAGIGSLAGCPGNSGNGNNPTDTATETATEINTSTPEPDYELQASNLQYDLTGLETSEADRHDEAYVEDNYSE